MTKGEFLQCQNLLLTPHIFDFHLNSLIFLIHKNISCMMGIVELLTQSYFLSCTNANMVGNISKKQFLFHNFNEWLYLHHLRVTTESLRGNNDNLERQWWYSRTYRLRWKVIWSIWVDEAVSSSELSGLRQHVYRPWLKTVRTDQTPPLPWIESKQIVFSRRCIVLHQYNWYGIINYRNTTAFFMF